nr:hypothetical protein GCM10010200_030330 [Actinomadura rugatobispora]
MSREYVALLREPPEVRPLLQSSARLRGTHLSIGDHEGTTHLVDPTGRLLVHLGRPMRIDVPGEVERLLHTTVPLPTWWIDIRAALNATAIALHCAEELVSRHGGTVWRAS